MESPAAPPIHRGRPSSLTHTFAMPKGRETNSKVSIKVSKVSIKSTVSHVTRTIQTQTLLFSLLLALVLFPLLLSGWW